MDMEIYLNKKYIYTDRKDSVHLKSGLITGLALGDFELIGWGRKHCKKPNNFEIVTLP
jgi:hypothetical protein